MDQCIYLDYQATTPCDPRVVEAMLPYFTSSFGNAHSDHALGQQAYHAVEYARAQVAGLLDVLPAEIIFTSGATEANNIAIQGAVKYLLKQDNPARRVITVCTEHKAVLETIHSLTEWGIEIVILPVDDEGLIDPEHLKEALETPTLLVSIMAANNETSVLHPIEALARIAHEYGALFHCDMAQAIGKISPWSFQHIDLASLSGHKLYAPKGVGALYISRKPRVRVSALFHGGYQERGIRSGTLAVPLIVGLGAACEILQQKGKEEISRLAQYKQQFLEGLRKAIPAVRLNGSLEKTLPNSMNLWFPGVQALDLFKKTPHLYLSTGSACTMSSLMPSYVLLAMGKSKEQALQSLRLSFGRMTNYPQIQQVIDALSCAYEDIMAGR
ncbi:Cysteine desulfurase/Cysteine sulfinate desulfinase IscS or related enzyme [Commensalibacter communis]|uniref:cysteine desulfurase family protein n=1 Tax=Commensalibacter communis TaxID=2972786 RepID=UPI0022FF8676|nr:cysteine desulfurase family protein [Commensalibacter communis]CAI3951516.1 Cysteine desulfurase/Cysteine sulfinate desulfinase IscS or related enzyme [Commensalibacter communis]